MKTTSRAMTAGLEAYLSAGEGKGGWNRTYIISAATIQRARTDAPGT